MKHKTCAWMTTVMLALAGFSLTTSLAQNIGVAAPASAKQPAAAATLMDSIPDIIFCKDLNGVYRGGNKAWARLAGKPLNQLIGKTDLDLFPGEFGKTFQAKGREMLASRQIRRNEEWVVYPDGHRAALNTLFTGELASMTAVWSHANDGPRLPGKPTCLGS